MQIDVDDVVCNLDGPLTDTRRCCNWWYGDAKKFGTFRANGLQCPPSAAGYYYEVKVWSTGIIQVGWATQTSLSHMGAGRGQGVGDALQSCGVDLSRSVVFSSGIRISVNLNGQVKPGDRVGCFAFHSDDKWKLKFFHNGEPIVRRGRDSDDDALDSFSLSGNEDLVPAWTLSAFQVVEVPLDVKGEGCPLESVSDDAQRIRLSKKFIEAESKCDVVCHRCHWPLASSPSPLHRLLGAIRSQHNECFDVVLREVSDLNVIDDEFGGAPIHCAAMFGYMHGLECLLANQSNIDLSAKDKHRKTALHFAAQNENADVIKCVASMDGIDVNAKDNYERTVLHYAAGNKNADVIKFVASMDGIDVNAKDRHERTALHFAAQNENLDVIKFVASMDGIDVNAKDDYERTALHFAAQNENLDVIKFVASMDGIDVNAKDKNERTALHFAAQNENLDVIKCVASMDGIDVNAKDEDGSTALHYAAENKNADVIKFVASMDGIDVNAKDRHERTVLHYAAGNKNADVIKFVASMDGIDVNAKDRHERTALHFAAQNENLDVIKCVASMDGIDVNAKDRNERTALHFAAQIENLDVIKCVASMDGIDVNAKDELGRTALHFAAQNKNADVIKCVASMDGIDVNAKDRHERTALHFAAQNENLDVIKCVASMDGIDVNAKDELGRTALHYAAGNKNADVIKCVASMDGIDVNAKDSDGRVALRLVPKTSNGDAMVKGLIEESRGSVQLDILHQAMCDTDDVFVSVISEFLNEGEVDARSLADLKDSEGRLVREFATKRCRDVLFRHLFLFGRYELSTRFEHESTTCVVVFAEDHGLEEDREDGSGTGSSVALKFMRQEEQFRRELKSRKSLDPQYVVRISTWFDMEKGESEDGEFDSETQLRIMRQALGQLKNFSSQPDLYRYILVMPRGDRDLQTVLEKENFTFDTYDRVSFIFKQVLEAVNHLHEKGLIHGDLKPKNIMRFGERWRLIDLDASARYDKEEKAGSKYSSAYCPPEMLMVRDDDSVGLRTSGVSEDDRLVADPSFDAWSLGVLLYEMCVKALFHSDRAENLDDEELLSDLMEWKDGLKNRKLQKIRNRVVRDLVSSILHRDPGKRLCVADILAHPFLHAHEEIGRRESRIEMLTDIAKDTNAIVKDTNVVAKDTNAVTKDTNVVAKDTNIVAKDTNVVAKDTNLRVKGLARLVTEFPQCTVPRLVLILPEAKVRHAENAGSALTGKSFLAKVKDAWNQLEDKVSPYVRFRVYVCCEGARMTDEPCFSGVCCSNHPGTLHQGYALDLPGPKLRKLAPVAKTALKVLKWVLIGGKVATGIPVPSNFDANIFGSDVSGLQELVDGFVTVMDDNKSSVSDAEKMTDKTLKESGQAEALDVSDVESISSNTQQKELYGSAYTALKELLEGMKPGDGPTWKGDKDKLFFQLREDKTGRTYWMCKEHAEAAQRDPRERFKVINKGEVSPLVAPGATTTTLPPAKSNQVVPIDAEQTAPSQVPAAPKSSGCCAIQ